MKYVGDCYVCGCGIHHYTGKDATNEHYVVLPYNAEQMELPENERPARLVRCAGCHPGSSTWMDSETGRNSPLRRYFEAGIEARQEGRVKAAAQRSSRVDVASPLLKSFAGRIRYFVHMRNVSGDLIPWKLELVDSGKYYCAELDTTGTLKIEAHGTEVPFEPKKTLTERIHNAVVIGE